MVASRVETCSAFRLTGRLCQLWWWGRLGPIWCSTIRRLAFWMSAQAALAAARKLRVFGVVLWRVTASPSMCSTTGFFPGVTNEYLTLL